MMMRGREGLKAGLLVVGAVFGALAMTSSASAQNLAANPGFEAADGGNKPISWTNWGNTWSVDASDANSTIAPYEGLRTEFIMGPYWGFPWANSGIEQVLGASEGQVYTLSGQSYIPNVIFPAGGGLGIAKLEFLDAGDGVIWGSEITIADDTMTADTWVPFSLVAMAPANTAKVKVLFLFLQPNGNDSHGGMQVDDVSCVLTNMLANAGLEQADGDAKPVGWTNWGNTWSVDASDANSTIAPFEGLRTEFIMGPYWGFPWANSGIEQVFAAAEGQQYTLAGQSYIPNVIYPAGGGFGIAKMEFLDAGDGAIWGPETTIADDTMTADTWAPFSLVATAPANTVKVKVLFLFLQPNGNDSHGGMMVDALEFGPGYPEDCCVGGACLTAGACAASGGTPVVACEGDADVDGVDGSCGDACPDDMGKTDPGQCGCGVADDDADGDGTADCNDNCPADPNKTEPGVCGCGVADDDSDGDGTADCDDNCPADPNKTEPGVCGCGVADDDSDGDGTEDCNDNCPSDADKTEPGVCGCGVADDDSDGDGTEDCDDGCPADSNKTAAGICGCGVADDDSDGDGTADCNDGCDSDAAKTAPGICGCGVSDVDSDADGTADCLDACPADAGKQDPGVCGCGVADEDLDGNGRMDCLGIPTVSQWGLVVLGLMLLIGSKVYFGRRKKETA